MPAVMYPLGRSETGHAWKSAAGAVSDPAVSGRRFLRDIHWKLSAKMDQMMSRQFAAKRRQRLSIWIFQKAVMRTSAVWMLSVSWPPPVLHGFLDAGHGIRYAGMIWRKKKSGEEKIIRNEEDYREW